MSVWNHRVMRHEKDGEVWYAIHEVHYNCGDDSDIKGSRLGWSEGDHGTPAIGETVGDLRWTLERMLEALDKDVLNYDAEEIIE